MDCIANELTTAVSGLPTKAAVDRRCSLDHPFLFLVRDTKTGAVLFASKIDNPTAG